MSRMIKRLTAVLLLSFGALSAHAFGGRLYEAVGGATQRFSAGHTLVATDRLRVDAEDAPAFNRRFAGAEPLRFNLNRRVQLPVYVSADLRGPRAGQGEAAVSLDRWVLALARQSDSLFILYEISPEQYGTGWIDTRADLKLQRVLDSAQAAQFLDDARARTTRSTLLFDDPINRSGEVLKLSKGVELKLLAEDADNWYVEVVRDGQRYWGFVKPEDVERVQ